MLSARVSTIALRCIADTLSTPPRQVGLVGMSDGGEQRANPAGTAAPFTF